MNLLLRRILVLAVPVAAAVLACTGPDPSAIVCKDRATGDVRRCNDAGRAVSSSTSSGSTSSTSSSSTSTSSSSGDGGSSGDSPFRNPTFGGTALTPTAQSRHTALGVGQMINRNAACLSCHKAGGNAPAFLAGGMVYTSSAASVGAENVEVWIYNASANQSAKVNSDSTGAFWFTASTTTVAAPFKIGVRSSDGKTMVMRDPNTGDCNSSSCHGQTTPGVFIQ